MNVRVGVGFDVHRLQEGRPFWLGGVLVPHHMGALGHSDADVVLHAISDAMLGAAALGDIGLHFPDTDQRWKDADSKVLLAHVRSLVEAEGWQLGNVDVALVLEKPKVRPHIDAMRAVIAGVLGVALGQVSIKATTNERMGFVGREEGVAAHAVALLHKG